MNHSIHFRLAWLVAAISACAASLAMADDVAPADAKTSPSQQQIQKWIRDLDSDRFVKREQATKNLLDAGMPAIEPLSQALPRTGLEVTTRGIFVLRELALDTDDKTAEAARIALGKLAELPGHSLARRALSTLGELDQIRQDRATEQLQALGAEIGTRHVQIGQAIVPNVFSIEIGDGWKGTTEDLRLLRWMTDVQQVSLSGPTVTDDTLAGVAQLNNVSIAVFKRANITDAGMAHLKDLSGIRHIGVFYCPIGDKSIDHLKVHKNASLLKLYGTQISKEGAEKLNKALATTMVDHRNGAFLGVGADAHPLGCSITIVQPESSAAKAGLEIDDVIVKYEGEKVTDFEQLTQLIGANRPGDTVTVEIVRGLDTLTKKITLGAWE